MSYSDNPFENWHGPYRYKVSLSISEPQIYHIHPPKSTSMSSFEALIAEAGKRREVATEYQKYLRYYEECFKTAKRLLVEGRS